MRAILEEVKRTVAEMGDGRSWTLDPHLRRGFLAMLPIMVVAALLSVFLWFRSRSPIPFLVIMVPVSILCNVGWFAFSARSRR